jgi:hypothetical protein
MEPDEIASWAKEGAWRCENVGWLIYQDAACIVLSCQWSRDHEVNGLSMRLPRNSIVSVQEVAMPPDNGFLSR